MRQFRPTRRRFAPYKSPRLATMLALLVCLFLIMGSLRSFREPGVNARRILSNLNQSLQQVNASTAQEPSPTPAPASPQDSGAVAESAPRPDDATAPPQDQQAVESENLETKLLDPVATEPQPADQPTAAGVPSNSADAPNLNLREDLELQDWLGLVQDGTLALQKLEMPAYWRMLSIVKRASFKSLLANADSKIRFNDLYSSAAKNRTKLITLNVNVRRISQYAAEENPAGIDVLYEVWGWSETSKAWLYVFVTPELPPGLDANTPVNQTAKFAGYFYKLQGYQPGGAKPNAKPLLAPLLIGKFELVKSSQRAVAPPANSLEVILGAAVLLIGIVAIVLRIFVFRAKKPVVVRSRPLSDFTGFPPDLTPPAQRDQDGQSQP